MAHWTFTDRTGRAWDVWSVKPTSKVERREAQAPINPGDDRRKEPEYRVVLGPGMAKGWLCFQSGDEKRRLAPFPRNWQSLEDRELSTLLAAAIPAKRQTPPNGVSVDVP